MFKIKREYGFLLALLLSCETYADFGFDDLGAMEQTEQTELLEQAKQMAKRNNFSNAEALLKEAQYKGYAPNEIAQTAKIIADSRNAHQAEEAEAQRLLAEQQAQQRRNQAQSNSSSRPRWITVSVDCIGFCTVKAFDLSGGNGNLDKMHKSYGIHPGYNGDMDGRYSYTVRLSTGNRVCSGSFNISGRQATVVLGVYENCNAQVSEY